MKYGRPVSDGEEVRVHYHLRKHVWVVSARVPGKGWQVAEYRDTLTLSNASPMVSLAGVARIQASGCRKVVAYIVGTLECASMTPCEGSPVRFNPHVSPDFMQDGKPWKESYLATFPADLGKHAYFIAEDI